jgi:hypothetical protein
MGENPPKSFVTIEDGEESDESSSDAGSVLSSSSFDSNSDGTIHEYSVEDEEAFASVLSSIFNIPFVQNLDGALTQVFQQISVSPIELTPAQLESIQIQSPNGEILSEQIQRDEDGRVISHLVNGIETLQGSNEAE